MTSHDPYPARRWRWPRFKLSTILVLVAIAAWAMSRHPWLKHESQRYPTFDAPSLGSSLFWRADAGPDGEDIFVWSKFMQIGTPQVLLQTHYTVNAEPVVWPGITLVAFLTWKLVWLIAARRKRRREMASAQTRITTAGT